MNPIASSTVSARKLYLFSQVNMSADINKLLGRYMRRRREEQSLNGHEVGKLMGLSQQQISRYERGENKATVEYLLLYLNQLHLPLEDLTTYLHEHLTS